MHSTEEILGAALAGILGSIQGKDKALNMLMVSSRYPGTLH